MENESVIYIYIYTYTHTQWNMMGISQFNAIWLELENMVLNESSQREQIPDYLTNLVHRETK